MKQGHYNEHLVKQIAALIKEADYVYFVSYTGLKVSALSSLRADLDKQGAVCHVFKNTLIRKASVLLESEELANLPLSGGTAIICGKGDAGAVAKIIVEFGKKNEAMAPKAGYLENSVLSADAVKDIAGLPSKAVLQAMLLGVLQAPSRNLVSVLNAKAASILNVLNAYKDKLEK